MTDQIGGGLINSKIVVFKVKRNAHEPNMVDVNAVMAPVSIVVPFIIKKIVGILPSYFGRRAWVVVVVSLNIVVIQIVVKDLQPVGMPLIPV